MIFLAACAATLEPGASPPGSRGLRASEHLAAARDEDALARADQSYPDELLVGEPFHRTWEGPQEHARIAQIHRGEAEQLQAQYEDACGQRGASAAAASPIERYGIGGAPTANGVVIYLSADAGGPSEALSAMTCHRAWLMLAPVGATDDPLDLDGIHVNATGTPESVAVTISEPDRALVGELQRRAERELETGARQRSAAQASRVGPIIHPSVSER
jgi:hypothetical protein